MATHLLAATWVVPGVMMQPAKPGDVRTIIDLVSAVNLPREGIEVGLEYFWVAREGETIVSSRQFRGVYREIGWVDGRWLATIVMGKLLNEA